MTDRIRFFDALTYGIRTLFWRPMRAVAYIAMMSLLTYGYYMWAQSESGMAFFTGYMEATQTLAQGGFGNYGAYYSVFMAGSLVAGAVMLAAAFRVYMRDEPVLRLPVRLGLDELRSLGLYLVVMALMIGIMIVAVIALAIIGILIALLFAPLMGSADADPSQAVMVGGLIGFVVMIPLMIGLGYIMGRVGVGFALTIRDRKVSLGGWKASKGAGMQLLWAHLVLYLLIMISQFVLAPGLMETAFSGVTNPGVLPDPQLMAASMANPYGDWLIIAVPLQTVMFFLLLGPSAAVANWDSRKRAAAEAAAAPAAASVVGPAPGVGTGEVDSGQPGEPGKAV